VKIRSLLIAFLLVIAISPARAETLSADTKMKLATTITGDIAPKSVRASTNGYVSAHNMMYRHSVTVYDGTSLTLTTTIPDRVNLKDFGVSGYSGTHRGSPVEGAFSPDNAYLYVTNYAMYGKGFNREGTDVCKPADRYDRSFLYRISTSTWEIDSIYKVGVVPKVVDVSPDNKYVLVSNWCSYDLSVISLEEQKVVKTIPIGAYPRGITISKDSKFAFVAQMGGSVVHKITLGTWEREKLSVGSNPRALVLSPDDSTLYVSLNASGRVVAYNLDKKKVSRSVRTGSAARSLDISKDGSALYVVNYKSNTLVKLNANTLDIVQRLRPCSEPIGVAYEPLNQRVWVACYGGAIKVFNDRP
jgi:YVTN family beta-propeller protein